MGDRLQVPPEGQSVDLQEIVAESQKTDDGRIYYVNRESGLTTWSLRQTLHRSTRKDEYKTTALQDGSAEAGNRCGVLG